MSEACNAKLGDTVYFEITPGLVVPATVTGVDDVYVVPQNFLEAHGLVRATAWVCTHRDAAPRAFGYSQPTSGNEWGFRDLLVEAVISSGEKVNQFVWIDEPVGHAVTVGDEVFTTLKEALANATTISRREAMRRHKKVQRARDRTVEFINRTHEQADSSMCCSRYTEKKSIYAKIGARVFNERRG